MRAVVQRVSKASVTVSGRQVAQIANGALVLLGIEDADSSEDVIWLAAKLAKLRIFADEHGLMNKSIAEACGQWLVVSQFTLFASTKKGNRPSFTKAAKPQDAERMYQSFAAMLEKESACKVQTGVFGADMKVELLNDGPVTILYDTKTKE
jgi:D-aminoacyl-tRNA deacylase